MNDTATTAAAPDEPRRRAGPPAVVVQRSGLPRELADLVLAVTGQCRLWPWERTDVARELCAHFLDGLEGGAGAGALADTFGNPRAAARLITAAKKRRRPAWWRAARTTLRAAACFLLVCALVYGVLAARFFLVRPSIKRNYMTEMNAPVRAIPEADRGWPLYLKAIHEFGRLPEFMFAADTADPRRPGDPAWDQMAAWLDAHETALATLREAASKPAHGYIYRSTIDPDYARAMQATRDNYTFDPSAEREVENPLVIGLLLPHLGQLRGFGRWLDADAHLAIERQNPDRFVADIDAILGMSGQCLKEPTTIARLVGIALADLATRPVLAAIELDGFLTDAHLRDLAHRLAGLGGGRIHIDASGERIFIEDVLQRFFSDDGHGNGRFIGAIQEVDAMHEDFGIARPRGLPALRALQPIQSVIIPSRAAISRGAAAFVAAAALDDGLPPWRHDERRSNVLWRELMESGVHQVFPAIRPLMSSATEGPVASACASRDIYQTRRDAALTALALETQRRRDGAWPESLEALVPSLLPAVPLDPFDGRPLRYRPPPPGSSDGARPLIYSVGVDEVDEGGRLPTTKAARFGVNDLQWQRRFRSTAPRTADEEAALNSVRGDWILWPVPPELPHE